MEATVSFSLAATGIIFANDQDRVINDFGKELPIVAVKASIAGRMSNNLGANAMIVDVAINAEPTFDFRRAIFAWNLALENAAGSSSANPTHVNETLGDFKTPIFDLAVFTSGLSAGQNISGRAIRGSLYMNFRANRIIGGNAGNSVEALIKLYYRK